MMKLHYSIEIEAPREKVWHTMLDPETYKQWTSAFGEGNYYEGSWDEGAEIKFLMADEQGGMIAEIAENRPFEFVSIRQLGMIGERSEGGAEPEIVRFEPFYENYTLADIPDGTELQIDMDIEPEFAGDMEDAWPRALAALKRLCEAG
jgi:hypothetical protein